MSKRKSQRSQKGKGVMEDVAKMFVNIPKSAKKNYQNAVKNSNGNFAHDFAQGFAVPFKVARDTRAISTLAPHAGTLADLLGQQDVGNAIRTTGKVAKQLGFGHGSRKCQF